MGTNYYAVKVKPTLYNRKIHIGKSSYGWLFLFHDCECFHSYPQVKRFLDDCVRTGEYVLFDEYGEEISADDFIQIVEVKQNDEHCKNNPENFDWGVRNIDGYRFDERDFS